MRVVFHPYRVYSVGAWGSMWSTHPMVTITSGLYLQVYLAVDQNTYVKSVIKHWDKRCIIKPMKPAEQHIQNSDLNNTILDGTIYDPVVSRPPITSYGYEVIGGLGSIYTTQLSLLSCPCYC